MEPENRISNKALTVWKISGLIGSAITWIISIAILTLTIFLSGHIGLLVFYSSFRSSSRICPST